MSQQLANIGRSHAHLVQPGGCCRACPVRGNLAHHISLIDTGQLTEERDRMSIEKAPPHQLVAILKEIVGWLVGLAIL